MWGSKTHPVQLVARGFLLSLPLVVICWSKLAAAIGGGQQARLLLRVRWHASELQKVPKSTRFMNQVQELAGKETVVGAPSSPFLGVHWPWWDV